MILVVCTGNLHRSPLLEVILRMNGVADVRSAGTRAVGGPVPPLMLRAADEEGIDLSRHESTQVTREMLEAARFVIAMERAHVMELSVMHEPAFRRTMTLREAAVAVADHPRSTNESLEEWLSAVLSDRKVADVLRAPALRDTPDPIGGNLGRFRECVADIRDTAGPLVEFLTALPPDS